MDLLYLTDLATGLQQRLDLLFSRQVVHKGDVMRRVGTLSNERNASEASFEVSPTDRGRLVDSLLLYKSLSSKMRELFLRLLEST